MEGVPPSTGVLTHTCTSNFTARSKWTVQYMARIGTRGTQHLKPFAESESEPYQGESLQFQHALNRLEHRNLVRVSGMAVHGREKKRPRHGILTTQPAR
jgi:hypothetical protein